ncbi:MAG: TRAP transporter small permease [Deltaproteobacteria bacterium]|nr:TRAP transporter small permease [Deltaproteobacteria bacterium]
MESMPEQRGFLHVMDKLAWIVERIAAIPCMIAIGGMTVIVILGVIFRYVLGSPLGWTEEAARYLMIWAASLAVSMGIMKGEHVGINLVVNSFPPKVRRWVAISVHLAILAFLWVLTHRGYLMAMSGRNQFSPLLGFTMIWSLAAIPIAGLLAMLQTVFLILKIICPSKESTN